MCPVCRTRCSSTGASVVAEIDRNLPTADPAVAFDPGRERVFVGLRTRLDSDVERVDRPLGPAP